jgi:hypothetical protein
MGLPSFQTIFYILSFLGLFFGLLSGLALDALLIIAQPTNPNSWKTLLTDFAKIIANSQGEISAAVKEFKSGITKEYANYLIARITGASLITLAMIYFIYRGMRFFVEAPAISTKILIIIVSFIIVWILGIIAGAIIGRISWVPFSGFIDLIREREVIIKFILENYQKKI